MLTGHCNCARTDGGISQEAVLHEAASYHEGQDSRKGWSHSFHHFSAFTPFNFFVMHTLSHPQTGSSATWNGLQKWWVCPKGLGKHKIKVSSSHIAFPLKKKKKVFTVVVCWKVNSALDLWHHNRSHSRWPLPLNPRTPGSPRASMCPHFPKPNNNYFQMKSLPGTVLRSWTFLAKGNNFLSKVLSEAQTILPGFGFPKSR